MAKGKTVEFDRCPCGKRGFSNRILAEKALGRARTKRTRTVPAGASRRGMKIENRIYLCPDSGMFHLTEQSRRTFESYAGMAA